MRADDPAYLPKQMIQDGGLGDQCDLLTCMAAGELALEQRRAYVGYFFCWVCDVAFGIGVKPEQDRL